MKFIKKAALYPCVASFAVFTSCSTVKAKEPVKEDTTLDKNKKLNVVFLEVDDLMYRFMGKRGRHLIDTPNIDKLAESGVYFSNAVCQGVMCGPSRNSLIAGLYPHNIGFYRNGQMGPLPDGIWSLGSAVQRAGYQTAWIGKTHVHPPRKGKRDKKAKRFKRMEKMGFDYSLASQDHFMLERKIWLDKPTKNIVYFDFLRKNGLFKQYVEDCKARRNTTLPDNAYLDGFFTQKAVDWLEQTDTDKKPFFLWLNFSLPHGPHDVADKYHDMYKDKQLAGPLSRDFGGVKIPERLLKDNQAVTPENAKIRRKGFAAACTYLDTLIGKVIDELKKKGVYDNTVIVFFSDHGIFMGNHGRIYKGTLFNEVTNPSLIISCPSSFRKNDIETQPVELLDIVKTVLDISGASSEDKAIPYGSSILPLLLNKPTEPSKRYVFSEIEGAQLCFDGRYRYIKTNEGNLLYDLQTDPKELKNIISEKPDIAAEMDKQISDWFNKTGKPLPINFLKNPEHRKNFKRKYLKNI